jgi:hypothetical protein
VEDGLSQYSAPSTATLIKATSGASGPPGNHTRSGSLQSSFCFAASRTTCAWPLIET